ncbi:MAG: ATP-dependent metalloprotease, partial [Pseudomonadales bacterium]
EAALFAARGSKRKVAMEQFEKAKDKIMMGAERKSMVMSEAERLNTAYHESGHAIVGRLMPGHDPVYKVSIIPRGRALGVTMFLPEEDRYSHSKQMILSNICSLYGGRIAEEMTLGKEGVTTGASNDIQRATSMARSMVSKWGLSDNLGPLLYDDEEAGPFGGGYGQAAKPMAESTMEKIDAEVRRIIDECYHKAATTLEENRDILESMTQALMKYETISSEQIDELMARQPVSDPEGWSDEDDKTSEEPAADVVDTEKDDVVVELSTKKPAPKDDDQDVQEPPKDS